VRRDFRAGALWLRPVAAVLARREARALGWLEGVERVPRLLDRSGGRFVRSWIEGCPLPEAPRQGPAFFADARRLLRRIHAAGVTHNDTHKEPNWLVTPDGRPALVDFQIAGRHAARTRWFRLCALEDLRHLLKHKRTHCPAALTRRERALLARRSWVARGWLATVKPVYVLVTRRLLRWRDHEGRG
jgi:RIO-like serine/threonine protein kinase